MSPRYLSNIIPCTIRRYASKNVNDILIVGVNNIYFMNTFFPYTITEWNKFNWSIRDWTSLNIFKCRILQFVKALENSVYACHNTIGTKYLARRRLGFNHPCFFNRGFVRAIDPFCSCSMENENIVYYFLYCPNFSSMWKTFLNEVASIDSPIID